MNGCQAQRFKPVLRCPRQRWVIPVIDAHERQLQLQEQETRLKTLCEGTTGQGREVFRRILDRVSSLTGENQNAEQVVDRIEVELRRFQELWPEFHLLLRRISGFKGKTVEPLRVRDLAVLLVLRARLWQSLHRQLPSTQTAAAKVT